ncbi:MAG: primosomal protein N' [Francisellaceae bacterium]|jgi:primosomal protein N' (replication factor Y) (superfamily II helicase)|nr:primosomal protein N' [Francisellaceae bacterium]MBT6538718.1 primosomal protein N' [Francisellaceae bacterium]
MPEKNAQFTNKPNTSDTPGSLIAHIYLFLPFRQYFDYQIKNEDEAIISCGARVMVPFGNRTCIGVVYKITNSSNIAHNKLKSVLRVLDNPALISSTLFKLVCYFSSYHHAPFADVFQCCLSPALRSDNLASDNLIISWTLTDNGAGYESTHLSRAPKQKSLFIAIQQAKIININDEIFTGASSTLKALQNKGLIKKISLTIPANDDSKKSIATINFTLNTEQKLAIESVTSQLSSFNVFLLFGITGSGKTQVYLQCCTKILQQSQQVLILVPEIGLTPQAIQIYKNRFPGYKINAWNSGQSIKEKNMLWDDIYNNRVDIIIGTRSAIWLPFKNLGIIIVDEEHDLSFKQQEGFLYHARDVAVARAKLHKCPIIIGSATPSLESLHNVRLGKYKQLNLTTKANNITQQQIQLVDIRHNKLKAGLSYELIDTIKKTIAKGEQVLIFLNRRGFAPATYCNNCQWLAKCKFCEINLTLHKINNILICHHCSYTQAIPNICPNCQHDNVFPVGVGTEQVENELNKLIPHARIARVDKDSITTKSKFSLVLKDIEACKIDILIGTQMIAKGHDYPNLTLAIIIDIDQSLFSSDYRSLEKAAQLVTQVAGRVGRGQKPGAVFLQSNQVEHSFFAMLKKLDYATTAKFLLDERHAANLPPATFQALLHANATELAKLKLFTREIVRLLNLLNDTEKTISILGPVTSPLSKIRNRHRQQILIQSESRGKLHDILARFLQQPLERRFTNSIRWNIDVAPQDFF